MDTSLPEELIVRRQELSAAGQAGLLPLLLLAPLFLFRVIQQHSPQLTGRKREPPPNLLQLQLRRITWLLNTTYIPEFGPLHVQIIGLAHFAWLLFLAFRKTSNDYMHLTKSLGHVAVSQLLLQYLLAFKSHKSPIRFATGLTHERLNAYHRLLGRMVHVLLASHAILYLKFFIDKDLLAKRILDWDVRFGIIAFWSFNILGILAVPVVRKKAYHALFYRSHVILTAVVLVVLWLHVPYTRSYIGLAAAFWVSNGMMRQSKQMKVNIETMNVDNGLLRVTLRSDDSRLLDSWVPGQHVYLHVPDATIPMDKKNPFTIVDINPDLNSTTLVVRKLAGTTASLFDSQKTRPASAIKLEGPYGEASEYLPGILSAGKLAGQILLVAGGVGATYTLPIYLALLRARGDTTDMKMLWFVKNVGDAVWATDLLRRAGQTLAVDIYVTQGPRQANSSAFEGLSGVTVYYIIKRPDIAGVLEPLLAAKHEVDEGLLVAAEGKLDPRSVKRNHSRLTVMVCGPPGLSRSLRCVVGKHVLGYGRDVRWYEEQFGFGGS